MFVQLCAVKDPSVRAGAGCWKSQPASLRQIKTGIRLVSGQLFVAQMLARLQPHSLNHKLTRMNKYELPMALTPFALAENHPAWIRGDSWLNFDDRFPMSLVLPNLQLTARRLRLPLPDELRQISICSAPPG